jgi:hypothetical protein
MKILKIRVILVSSFLLSMSPSYAGSIDRHALVTRHNIIIEKPDERCALQVGNGEFAFNVDVTGLQTFYGNTLSQWGWHSSPLSAEEKIEDYRWPEWDHAGRKVPYMTGNGVQDNLRHWLYTNPHRLPLGRMKMRLTKSDGKPAGLQDLTDIHQKLDLWSGLITSRFKLEGQLVNVKTLCDPGSDAVSIQIESNLMTTGQLQISLDFPYADSRGAARGLMGNWKKEEAHQTVMTLAGGNRADFARTLDATTYSVSLAWSTGVLLQEPKNLHCFLLSTKKASLGFTCAFALQSNIKKLPTFASVKKRSSEYWKQFWQSGGAIDLSGSKDTRWFELERRIVLSQYLMAVNEAGSLPPQESGLVNNSDWSGKFHLEMYWWHAAHYALWDRWPLWDRSLGFLKSIIPQAHAIAEKQGYKGIRWPKMIGPEGRDSPNHVNSLLIWQQPHPIFYAELDYRAHPTKKTLDKWRELVFGTAEFMADFPVWNETKKRFELAPPLRTVPENTEPEKVLNPTFELSYWRFGLRTAQLWRERLKLSRDATWDKVLNGLSPLPTNGDVYVMEESQPDTYENHNWEHPSLVGTLGMLPGDGVDPAIAKQTVLKVEQTWNWNRTWGWDFPMVAMCAAKVGEPKLAVDMLLHPSGGFQFNKCGLATGGPFPYFPSNGGLLYAVALMTAGWDGAPDKPSPGFPDDGSWVVKWEGLKRAP